MPSLKLKFSLALACAILLQCASLSSSAAVPNSAPAPDAGPAATCLLNWFEGQYPSVVGPAGGASHVRDSYYYRDYTTKGTRLALGSGRVWLLGQKAVDLSEVGTIADWMAQSGCQAKDTTAPMVLFTSRSDDAVEVPRNQRIAVAFSEPINPVPLADALTVTGDDGQRVQGVVRYDQPSASLVFDPAGDLPAARRFTLAVSAQIRDLSGNLLSNKKTWHFTTTASERRYTEVQQQLQLLIDRAMWTNAIPGGTMAFLNRDGSLWTASSGLADLSLNTPMTDDKLLRIGSNTKTYVATAILQLVDAGQIHLDVPINTYLADEMTTYMPNFDGSKITVRQLLNHTSGLVNFTTDPTWGNAFVNDPTKRYYPQELLAIANALVKPGAAPAPGNFSYSNTNYVLLGLILGKVGATFEDQVRNTVLKPTGLNSTLIPVPGYANLPPDSSRGYYEEIETGLLYDVSVKDPSMVWSSGDMIASIGDLARWGRELYLGSLLSVASQKARMVFVEMSSTLEYGLGIVRDKRANLFGHQGGIIGYTSQTYYVADESATLAFFFNRTLSMPDYSAVMTYDALKVIWPDRYRWFVINPVGSSEAPTHDGG